MKRWVSFCLVVFICVTGVPAWAEESGAELSILAPSAILMEAGTGQILFEQNSHERRPPASVTKVMTMLLTVEAIARGEFTLDDMVTCSEFAASMGGSQVYLEPGEQMSVRDMLKAVAVASGNDAAAALSEHVAGSHEAFVSRMNERAKELGMNETHFVNCNGLDDPEHVTSAYDIALMSRELLKHETILEFTGIWMDSLRGGEFGLVNTNKLIRFYEGATGLKTGSTSVAKYCLSATAKRNGMHLIAVVLGAETSKERFADASRLLDYGFGAYSVIGSLLTEEELSPIPVLKGKEETVTAVLPEDFHILVAKSKAGQMEKKISVPERIGAPIYEGETIGTVEFFIDGAEIGRAELKAQKTVERESVLGMFKKLSRQFFLGKM